MGEEMTILCAECGTELAMSAPAGAGATPPRCQKCGREVVVAGEGLLGSPVTAAAAATPATAPAATSTCPYCLSGIKPGEEVGSCPGCHAVYHRECWQENGGCAVYGCSQAPAVEGRAAIEVPLSYWGQENKPCPSCGQQILAAAKRCRHCGTTFVSARPQGVEEFQSRTALEERLPAARSRAVTIFIFSLVPFLAPVGAVWGFIWSRSHREELAALPALYPALVKIGFVAALVQTLALVAMTFIYSFVRHG